MTLPLWTGAEISRALDIAVPENLNISGISIDSRTLEPGDLFFAVQGVSQDGHAYIQKAFEAGAAAAVIHHERISEFADYGTLIAVDDVLEALIRLGQFARKRSADAYIIAVTGSVGKTSTKEMLKKVFTAQGVTHASVASYNNHWGVPLTLARMPRDTEYGIFEIGMNHPGEIRPLVQMVRPHMAIITSVEPVHLEFFTSVNEIADAKAEIFSGMEAGGIAILNRDNPWFERLKIHALAQKADRVISFGEHEEADIRAERIVEETDGNDVTIRIFGQEMMYHLGIPGHHMALNSLAVLAAIRPAGGDILKAADSLGNMQAPKGRGERFTLKIHNGSFTLIDESYNANPASMRAALRALSKAPVSVGNRRIAVLGPMRELGQAGPQLHKDLLSVIEDVHIDQVFLAGDLMEELYHALPRSRKALWVEHSADLVEPLIAALAPGDVVMVKGSLSTQMGLVVKGLKEACSG